jgi:hypothetical protein
MTSDPGDFGKRGTTGNVAGFVVPEFPQVPLGLEMVPEWEFYEGTPVSADGSGRMRGADPPSL